MRAAIVMVVGLLALPAQAAEPDQRLGFVKEYVHELISFEGIRQQFAGDMGGTTQDKMSSCVKSMTRFQLELSTYMYMIDQYKLPAKLAPFPGIIKNIYQSKSQHYANMEKACEAFLGGPRPDVDYQKYAAEIPKISAQLDFDDESLFKITPAVAFALVDFNRLDTDGKLHHLITTKAERADLLDTLNRGFKNIDSKNANFLVECGWEIKLILTGKTYKAADEA